MNSRLTIFFLFFSLISSCKKVSTETSSDLIFRGPSSDGNFFHPDKPKDKDDEEEDEDSQDDGADTDNSNGADKEHVYGELKLGGFGAKPNSKEVPITFVFVNSSSKVLSNNVQLDAQKAIDKINLLFSHQNHSLIKFKLKEAKEVVDNNYHNSDCDNKFYSATQKYSQIDSLVMLVVNDLAGSCAGVSWLWVFPKDKMAVTQVEYRSPFVQGIWTPMVHEFSHSMGVHHTGNEYSGSVPATGLLSFNQYLGSPYGINKSKKCKNDFKYFVDPQKRNTQAIIDGLDFNSYHNTMYPSYGGQPDKGFFNSPGYAYSFSWAYSCWYEQIEADL